mmetsp:Transcript_16225/g.33721  ORF Transcript_16225/g.33721 Transcript_16225/m.33721 type:complete len:358 (+) Transcript_16225:2711-3784(+)
MAVVHPVERARDGHFLEETPRGYAGSTDHAGEVGLVVASAFAVRTRFPTAIVVAVAVVVAAIVVVVVVVQKHHVVVHLPFFGCSLWPRLDVDGNHRLEVPIPSVRVDGSDVRVQSPGPHPLAELEFLAPAHGRGGDPTAQRIVADDRIEILGNVLDPGFRCGVREVLGIDHHVAEIAGVIVVVVLVVVVRTGAVVLVVGERHRIPQGGIDFSHVPLETCQRRGILVVVAVAVAVAVAVVGCLATQDNTQFPGVLNGPIQNRLVGDLVGGGIRHGQNSQRVLEFLFGPCVCVFVWVRAVFVFVAAVAFLGAMARRGCEGRRIVPRLETRKNRVAGGNGNGAASRSARARARTRARTRS